MRAYGAETHLWPDDIGGQSQFRKHKSKMRKLIRRHQRGKARGRFLKILRKGWADA